MLNPHEQLDLFAAGCHKESFDNETHAVALRIPKGDGEYEDNYIAVRTENGSEDIVHNRVEPAWLFLQAICRGPAKRVNAGTLRVDGQLMSAERYLKRWRAQLANATDLDTHEQQHGLKLVGCSNEQYFAISDAKERAQYLRDQHKNPAGSKLMWRKDQSREQFEHNGSSFEIQTQLEQALWLYRIGDHNTACGYFETRQSALEAAQSVIRDGVACIGFREGKQP